MDGISEEFMVRHAGNLAVFLLEFLHRRMTQVFGRRQIYAEVDLKFLFELGAFLVEQTFDLLGELHAFLFSVIASDEYLQRLGEAELSDHERPVQKR